MSKITKIKEILNRELEIIKPSKIELSDLNDNTREILNILEDNIKKAKIKAVVFVGGSFAKGTLIKKNKYDIDIFVRFDRSYDDEKIAGFLSRIVPKGSVRLHGSRDYFKIKKGNVEFEIIPVLRIAKQDEAKNITDLSYFHVNYVRKKIEAKKGLADEMMLAKAFLHFSDCYGAESYINGFSGYAVELLILTYGSFIKFVEAVAKSDVRKQKIILDPAKLYKNKEEIMREMNEAKLFSPIVLVDPTHRERNALAALSLDTFMRFKDFCRKFLASPSESFFVLKDKEANFDKKHGKNSIKLEFYTKKQAGDIAGTKLRKFSGFILREIEKYFDLKDSEFVYDEENNLGKLMMVVKAKKKILFSGPPIAMKKPLEGFKKEHKNIKIKDGKAYAIEKNNLSFDSFLDKFQNEKSKFIEDMDVNDIRKL